MEAAEASPPVGSPPCSLWFQRPGVYEDEKGRIWVAVALHIIPSYQGLGCWAPESTHDDSITVHLWQLPNQMPMSPSSLLVAGLPIKWELYPGRRYRGTDYRFWEIVDHGQVISTENLILKRLPGGSH